MSESTGAAAATEKTTGAVGEAGHPPFWVLIPARLSSTRLPNKPLADLGGVPMVVRVAHQAAQSLATACVVAADDERIAQACADHGIRCVLTSPHHLSGSDRLAEACDLLALPDDAIVVNVQGDEPLIPPALIDRVALTLHQRPDCAMSTAAHAIDNMADFLNPNVVKVVTDSLDTALYFSRAPIPWWRDGLPAWGSTTPTGTATEPLPQPAPLRHIGIYGYRVGFLRRFPTLASSPLESLEMLEQLRVLWHGERIAVHITTDAPAGGVDTPADLERVRHALAGDQGQKA
jgi:3-deoxy-manno-octulosonate cytidylyltransferase (CMP-KDO synthetase)